MKDVQDIILLKNSKRRENEMAFLLTSATELFLDLVFLIIILYSKDNAIDLASGRHGPGWYLQ